MQTRRVSSRKCAPANRSQRLEMRASKRREHRLAQNRGRSEKIRGVVRKRKGVSREAGAGATAQAQRRKTSLQRPEPKYQGGGGRGDLGFRDRMSRISPRQDTAHENLEGGLVGVRGRLGAFLLAIGRLSVDPGKRLQRLNYLFHALFAHAQLFELADNLREFCIRFIKSKAIRFLVHPASEPIGDLLLDSLPIFFQFA
jgi:hypothetical protein